VDTRKESARDPARRLRILALEPWFSGSHERFLAQWSRRSRHDVRVIGLAARDWKWRMRSSSHELARRVEAEASAERDLGSAGEPDLIFASDYVDLAALYGWLPARWRALPSILYFHENQLTYPLRPEEEPRERDLHFAFTNILSALRASEVLFNSRYHRDELARASDELLARMPRPNPRAELRAKLSRAQVIAPGVDLDEIELGPGAKPGSPLRVVFNHRWEHDKDPLAFLSAAREALRRGAKLELVLLGETFETLPPGTSEILSELAPIVRRLGFLADRAQYVDELRGSDVVVSTARHEFFGVSIAEAMAAGCAPLAPRRLAYPELVPEAMHARCLHADGEDLIRRLVRAAAAPDEQRSGDARSAHRAAVERFACGTVARRLDELVSRLALESGRVTCDTWMG
jgi:glycosyltransferase involved in cell wall biosynthesis